MMETQMEFTHQQIVKMLQQGPMTAGDIRNRLNGEVRGLDVSQDEVLDALRRLEAQLIVECQWRINQTRVQTPTGAPPDPLQN